MRVGSLEDWDSGVSVLGLLIQITSTNSVRQYSRTHKPDSGLKQLLMLSSSTGNLGSYTIVSEPRIFPWEFLVISYDASLEHLLLLLLLLLLLYGSLVCALLDRTPQRHFTSIFPSYGRCSFQYQLNSLASMQPLLPSRCWKLFKHTSNHCPIRYCFTPGMRECTYRWSALPNDTIPHLSGTSWSQVTSVSNHAMMPCPRNVMYCRLHA